jgi:glycosyltransferase involved in cell wall biosynthesis
MWSGSEELWTRSAKELIRKGYKVAFASMFDHPELPGLPVSSIILPNPHIPKPFIKRLGEKLQRFSQPVIALKRFMQHINPRLVIISQGNNIDSIEIMHLCTCLQVPFVTLTQLVTELHFSAFKNEALIKAQKAYLAAKKNYFVSQHNLQLNNMMLGLELPNAEIVFNPCKIADRKIPDFPSEADIYNIGLVGRIECLHKGYDLLLQATSQEKWKERPVRFNIYGSGPHQELIKANCLRLGITNILLKGHENNVSEIWQDNQLLCLPSRMEGQALALIEAMWCNRAAVVTNVGGAAELIEEGCNGFIAEAPTAGFLDAALERAWDRRSQWKEIGKRAGETIREKYPADAVDYFNQKIAEQFA